MYVDAAADEANKAISLKTNWYKANMENHLLSLTVENRFGMLARIAGLFSARGYNINSLVVAPTEDATVSRMVLTVAGDEHILEQIIKQLNKLIGVIRVTHFTAGNFLERELLLVRVSFTGQNRFEIIHLAEMFKGRVVDLSRREITIELVGESRKVDGFLEMLFPYGVKEVVRTGPLVIGQE